MASKTFSAKKKQRRRHTRELKPKASGARQEPAPAVDWPRPGSAKDPFGNTRVGFEGALAIKRSDWGLTWNTPLDTGGVLVSDRIQIEFDVSAVRVS